MAPTDGEHREVCVGEIEKDRTGFRTVKERAATQLMSKSCRRWLVAVVVVVVELFDSCSTSAGDCSSKRPARRGVQSCAVLMDG